MRIALLGFGLIGGSIARALRRGGGDWRIEAWTPRGAGPRRALEEGIVDEAAASPADAVRHAEIIVLAGPPLTTLELIDDLGRGELARAMADGAVVTDTASTKEAVLRRADAAGLRFVGGHPMAGRESTGYEASVANLFDDQPWVIVPGRDAHPGDREVVMRLALACGARPVEMSAAAHDTAVAAISHLPLVVAAALVEAVAGTAEDGYRPDWDTVAGLAAGGWRGMTRLARGDVAMGAGIIASNGPAIAARVRELRDVLDRWLIDLERDGGPDDATISARLAAARHRLEDSP